MTSQTSVNTLVGGPFLLPQSTDNFWCPTGIGHKEFLGGGAVGKVGRYYRPLWGSSAPFSWRPKSLPWCVETCTWWPFWSPENRAPSCSLPSRATDCRWIPLAAQVLSCSGAWAPAHSPSLQLAAFSLFTSQLKRHPPQGALVKRSLFYIYLKLGLLKLYCVHQSPGIPLKHRCWAGQIQFRAWDAAFLTSTHVRPTGHDFSCKI